jgi:ribonucleoside-triphosphate reductase
MDYRYITDTTSDQWELSQIAYTDEYGLRKVNDYYCVAMGSYYSENVGDKFEITLENGNKFNVIIGDLKQDCHTDATNQYTPVYDNNGNFYGANVIEFIVVTINLVDVALTAKKNNPNDIMTEFWEIFDKRLELCHRALICRYERLKGTPSDVAPILWQYGALTRLKKDEVIDKYLTGGYSSISLGYAGLWECVYALTGHKLTEKAGQDIGKKIMQYMNDKCDNWNKDLNLGFSIYGTPLESTTYKFAKCLQKRFGIIKGVTDKNYITNSYHIHVTEPIDAFTKLSIESEFQSLSTGGAISYVEVPNLNNNIEAVLEVIKFIYNHIMYAELNTKSDYCQVCGFDGEIQIIKDDDGKLIWECPNCGNRDEKKLNVARRTCGLN